MKTLFIGGIKSGKSRLAEVFILKSTTNKPYYLATTEFIDQEMQQRIASHQQRRQDKFITIEEPLHLSRAIKDCPGAILIECMSMWLNNMLYHQHTDDQIFHELTEALALPNDLVFVINEVGLGVIADNPLVRQFVDLSGRVAQLLAAQCDQVYLCSAGLKIKLK
ncbi:MAG: bifunctional adenosylcobinamide kinase/adenosylcobinamide-phosphate guanylyltransferase [Methyloglobulus sp.]|nr:bifunctional adenosylcobinamide kinase/adenosylcobinamide-phosphate guanylyltransferase [Methyloglobulus sp.]